MSLINLTKPYRWDDLNEATKKNLGTEATVRVFQSLSHALMELAIGVEMMYSHKRTFHYSLGLGTHADELLVFFSRQGIKGLEFKAGDTPEIDDKKALFTVADIDDALTGEVYHDPATSTVDNKIFRIWVSHHRHRLEKPNLNIPDMDIFIFATKSGEAIACIGKRGQNLQPFMTASLRWPEGIEVPAMGGSSSHPQWVKQVESEKWAGGQALLPAETKRLGDRALLFWPDLEANALREILVQDYQAKPDAVEALSFSRWSETKLVNQFSKRQWPPETFRGLLILSSELSGDPTFKK